MLLKKVSLAALAGTVLLSAAPAFADQGWGNRSDFRGGHFQSRPVFIQYHGPRYYAQRPVFAHRPVVVYRDNYGAQVLGGLILGTVIGAAIANHNGY